jgi:ferredoxin
LSPTTQVPLRGRIQFAGESSQGRPWVRCGTDPHADAAFASRRASPIRHARGCRLCNIACPDPVLNTYAATLGIRAARDALRSAPDGSVRVELRLCRIRTRRRVRAWRSERPRESVACANRSRCRRTPPGHLACRVSCPVRSTTRVDRCVRTGRRARRRPPNGRRRSVPNRRPLGSLVIQRPPLLVLLNGRVA